MGFLVSLLLSNFLVHCRVAHSDQGLVIDSSGNGAQLEEKHLSADTMHGHDAATPGLSTCPVEGLIQFPVHILMIFQL